MYAKVFASLWDGTLCGLAHPQLVFIYLLAHANPDGHVDIHPRHIAQDCGLSTDDVIAAIQWLERPDPDSRSPEQGGARIARRNLHHRKLSRLSFRRNHRPD